MTSAPEPALRAGEHGRAGSPAVALLALLVSVVVLGAVVVGRVEDPGPAGSPDAGRRPDIGPASPPRTASPSPSPTPTVPPTGTSAAAPCTPGPGLAAPTIDLGVQVSTPSSLRSREQVDQLVALATGAGATVISTTASWRDLQPTADTAPADFAYRGVDRVVRSARAAGLQVRLQLVGMPRWAVSDPGVPWSRNRPPVDAAERQRWTAFVTEVARHVAGSVSYLEVWNEPNGAASWPPGPDPTAFADLLAATYAPVKAVAPDLQVVTGGLVGNDIGYLDALYDAVDALGPTRPFDLVGVHPFTGTAPPDAVDPARTYVRAPNGLLDKDFTGYAALHEVMSEHGDGDLDLYLGAFGYDSDAEGARPGVPDDVRAGYVARALEQVTCTPYVRALSWYYLHPTPWDPASWTLVDRHLQPNLTYRAFVAWKEAVAAAATP